MINKTRQAYIWARMLSVPFWGMICLLSVILYKNMQITPLQITLIITLKPLSALFAPYWSERLYKRPDRLISNLIWGNLLRYLPFFFVPWIQSAWIIIAAFGFYMVFYRGSIPAWMEIIKRNLPPLERERLVGFGSAIDYCATAVFPFIIGAVLDKYETSWQWLFPLTAAIGLVSILFLYRVPIADGDAIDFEPKLGKILQPWKHAWQLVKQQTSFSKFQIGFMLGGAGLMILQPALPMFFVDVLDLSYKKISLALAVCKGVGIAMAMPFWVKLFRKWNIFYLSGIVSILAALFPLVLLTSQLNILFLYLSYGLYGIMQAGSELSWNMSGPVFAKNEDSTRFSGTNALAVGIRGCIIPPLGALLYSMTNSTVVMIFGSIFCLLSARHHLKYSTTSQTATE